MGRGSAGGGPARLLTRIKEREGPGGRMKSLVGLGKRQHSIFRKT